MTSTANGTRLRSYEEIEAGRQDISVRIVQFASTDELTAFTEEYEEKATMFEEPLGALMLHIAALGREELSKREAVS